MASPAKDLELTLDAIGNPVRRRILRLVAETPLPVSRIAAQFDISRPAISKHLSVLRRAGLIRHSIAGNQNLYEPDEAGFIRIRDWLDTLQTIAERKPGPGTRASNDEIEDPFAGLLDD